MGEIDDTSAFLQRLTFLERLSVDGFPLLHAAKVEGGTVEFVTSTGKESERLVSLCYSEDSFDWLPLSIRHRLKEHPTVAFFQEFKRAMGRTFEPTVRTIQPERSNWNGTGGYSPAFTLATVLFELSEILVGPEAQQLLPFQVRLEHLQVTDGGLIATLSDGERSYEYKHPLVGQMDSAYPIYPFELFESFAAATGHLHEFNRTDTP